MTICVNSSICSKSAKSEGGANMKNRYQIEKEKARNIAITWQIEESDYSYSYGGLMILQEYFYKLGKRYGLLKEFRENGIPC